MVKVGETGCVLHLEIVAVGKTCTAATKPVDSRNESKRYGFTGLTLKME